jgi:hypothetical protein
MAFVPSAMGLVEPSRGTWTDRFEKPQRMGSRIITLAPDDPAGETNVSISGRLIKVRPLHGFKASGRLEHHRPDRPETLKIQTIPHHPVDADIAYQQHSHLAVLFRFRPHQTRQQFHFITIGSNRHAITSRLFYVKAKTNRTLDVSRKMSC